MASSSHCENFGGHYSDTSLCVHGHLEFEPVYGDPLMELQQDILPDSVALTAKGSLQSAHDNSMAIRTSVKFLRIGSV